MSDERYCSNCRLELPRGAASCPACGVYAGDLFDGKIRKERRTTWRGVLFTAAVTLILGIAAWYALNEWAAREERSIPSVFAPRASTSTAPVRVVRSRPGGNVDEAEAIRTLRRHLASTGVKDECLVVMSNGRSGHAFVLTAYDRCTKTRLGKWKVNAKTGAVTR
jgi:hypothetical protein